MRHIAVVLALVAAALPLGAKWKTKHKQFDPVAVTNVREIAGRYVGIDPDFVIELRVSDQGALSGTMRNFGQTAALTRIRIDGAELSAMFDGRPLHATFVNRILNGASAFGLIVQDVDVQIDDLTLQRIFCRRVRA